MKKEELVEIEISDDNLTLEQEMEHLLPVSPLHPVQGEDAVDSLVAEALATPVQSPPCLN